MRKTKSEGITLIALVVTIIIILILAGVTISTLFGDNSIINQAKRAEEESKKSNYQDALDTLGVGIQVQGMTDNLSKEEYFEKYKEAIENDPLFEGANITDIEGEEEGFLVETKDDFVFKVTPENVTYVGKIGDKGLEEPPTIEKSGIEFKHNPEGWTNKEIKVEITTTEKDFRLQYALSNPEKGSSWKDYKEAIEFKENGYIYARLVNNLGLGTNAGEEKHATHEVTQIDKNAPQGANIEVAEQITTNENVEVKVIQTDNSEKESGIDYQNSKWILNEISTQLGIKDEDISKYGEENFGTNENPKTSIIINKSTRGQYYLHILTVDNAGNRKETIKAIKVETPKNEIGKEYGKKQENGNKTVTDNDKKQLTIPGGYTLVDPYEDATIEYVDKDNPTVNDGLVIKDDNGNEFVWVPVPDVSTMYGIDKDGNYLGKLYNYTNMKDNVPSAYNWIETSGKMSIINNNDIYEPRVTGKTATDGQGNVYNCDNYPEHLNIVVEEKYEQTKGVKTIGDFNNQLKAEFKDMVESVIKYKGFYIGRYETGNIISTTSIPVVKKYNKNLGTAGVHWYYQYSNSKKIIGTNSNYATTSMIWSCQWDATLNWFLNQGLGTYVTSNKINGKVKGNYKDNIITYKTSSNSQEFTKNKGTGVVIPTGGSEETKVKNIYDMAGNVYEFSMAAWPGWRSQRGGYCYDDAITIGAYYNSNSPTAAHEAAGSRATLYLKNNI